MVRSVLAVVISAVVWIVGFWILSILLAHVWPDYAIHGRRWMREGVFTFTAPMACCNLVLWALAEIGSGWVAGKIAKRREAGWVLAGLLGAQHTRCTRRNRDDRDAAPQRGVSDGSRSPLGPCRDGCSEAKRRQDYRP
jgi:hypothetical protein